MNFILNSKNKINLLVCSLTLSMVLAGCSASENSTDLLSKIGEGSCQSVEIFSYDSTRITFKIPKEALEFKVSRDSFGVFETTGQTETQFIDADLTPGQTYRYRCEIIIDVNIGYQKIGEQLTVTLPDSIPPVFSGLKTATLTNATTALLTWDPVEDAILSHFKVFKYVGTALDKSDFPATPVATLSTLPVGSNLVANLGDELTYSFRVTACNASDVCDDNNAILTVNTPNTGPPLTSGATDIVLNNGVVSLTAPWDDSKGHVANRSVYRVSTGSGSACPAVFGLYGKVSDVNIAEPRDTPTFIDAAGVLTQGLKYCFVVRDTDGFGNTETNFNIQSVEIGDITSPDFNSLVNATRDLIDPEGKINVTWTAMTREIDDDLLGAHEYLIYISSTVPPAAPAADPCSTGVLSQTILSAAYASGAIVTASIVGLNPRNNHRVCVKARDSSSNLSAQSPNTFISTGDTTAPSFSGIQAAVFNAGTASVDFTFVVPFDADVKNYKITTIRTRGGVVNAPVVITKNLGALVGGTTSQGSFTLAEASLGDNDDVAIRVDACDDASPTYNATDNCSSTPAEVSLTLPDATPPPGFTGITASAPGGLHRSVQVSWNAPVDWTEYTGFKVYYVDAGGSLVGLNSSDCLCTGSDCLTNPKLTCIVDREDGGAFLVPSKTYEMYVAAFDVAGNQTTSYIAHTGGSKITSTSLAQDLTAPSFNASMALTYAGGVKIVFDKASDDQDPSLEMSYEIYRKSGATFSCPVTPYSAGGGCDNLAPLTTVLESALGVEGLKKTYLDVTVTDGVDYYYQLCALDVAGNRTCQGGAVGFIGVTDVTAPVITNAVSGKTFGGGASWAISFDVTDNIVPTNNLILKVFKSAVGYPTPAEVNGGLVADFSLSGASISLAGNTASFTDTGVADVDSMYYLILAQDLNGNKTYQQIRDMSALPVITNVIWPAPLSAAGNPVARFLVDGVADFFRRIQGTNLDKIAFINDALGTLANANDVKHCVTARISTQTPTEIICDFAPTLGSQNTYTLYIRDQYGRDLAPFVSGTPWNYCDYADDQGITDLRGDGTHPTKAYTLCSPAHVKLIGRNADNPNNAQDIIGNFTIGRDIDFTGVTDFKGIPSMAAGDFYLDGMNRRLMNLTIDTTVATGDGTENGAAFLLGCTGTSASVGALFWRTTFYNFTIKTGAGKAAVMILNNNCVWPSGSSMLNSTAVRNSKIYSNNTAGFIAAEMNLNQGNLGFQIWDSTIYSTRPDDTTSVGGAFGKLTGTAVAERPKISSHMQNVTFNPAVGQTDAGYNIGGLVGELSAPNIDFGKGSTAFTINININGGLDNIGGLIGRALGTADNVIIQDYSISTNIDTTGSTTDHRGGVIGKLHDSNGVGGGVVNNLLLEGVRVNNSSILGNDYIGGLIGLMDRSSDVTIQRHIASGQISRVRDSSIIASGSRVGGVWGHASVVFAGLNLSEVEVSNTDVSGAGSVGGLGGSSGNSLVSITDSSYRGGTVSSAAGSAIGGLVGGHFTAGVRTYTVLRSSVGDAVITGASYVGGLIGRVQRGVNNLSDNYVNDNVTITGAQNVGGLVGEISGIDYAISESLTLVNNANYAKVTAIGAIYAGAFYGRKLVSNGVPTISNNYYKNDWPVAAGVMQLNEDPDVAGEIEGMAEGLAGLGVLAVQANYVGWDFVTLWEMRDGRAKLQNTNGLVGL